MTGKQFLRKALMGAVGLVLTAILVLATVWLVNASFWIEPSTSGAPGVIAHRGVPQPFSTVGLDNQTCTAAQSLPADHRFLENTLPSMRAAFDAGADIVELDIHRTADGQLAVFHDWTLDCRTNGHGETRKSTMAHLRTLDLGYGYTTDGGQSWPLRGSGVGLMPTLSEVFSAFPEGRFMIDIKSGDVAVADTLADLLAEHPEWVGGIWAINGTPHVRQRLRTTGADLTVIVRSELMACLRDYLLQGWSGSLPEACRGRIVFVPVNLGPLLWGWPHRFTQRIRDGGGQVVLIGPHQRGNVGSRGLDSAADLHQVPSQFDGYLMTNRVLEIMPLLGHP